MALADSVETLQLELDVWLRHYNTERPHPGYRKQGGGRIEAVKRLEG